MGERSHSVPALRQAGRVAAEAFAAGGWWLLLISIGILLRAVTNLVVAGRDFEPTSLLVASSAAVGMMGVVTITIFGSADVSGHDKVAVIRQRSRATLMIFGFVRAPRQVLKDAAWGIPAAAVILAASLALTHLVPWPPANVVDPRVAYVGPNGPGGRVAIALLYGPPLEEVFWRGGLLLLVAAVCRLTRCAVVRTCSTVALLLLTSVAFGWSHLEFSFLNAATATIMGLVCGIVALWRESLVPALVAHALLNMVVLLLAFAT